MGAVDLQERREKRCWEMGARLTSNEIHTGPFTAEVAQALKIKNPTPTPIAFKVCLASDSVAKLLKAPKTNTLQVKTTAPKQYENPPSHSAVPIRCLLTIFPDTVSDRTPAG